MQVYGQLFQISQGHWMSKVFVSHRDICMYDNNYLLFAYNLIYYNGIRSLRNNMFYLCSQWPDKS